MRVLITGGAGFIGSNAARYFLARGHQVVVVDNLSRKGSEKNLTWLEKQHGEFCFFKTDIRDYAKLKETIQQQPKIDVVIHLAGQVAVTTSVDNPREDFEINAMGTLNLLEAIRDLQLDPILLYASTNKVYGEMEAAKVVKLGDRYAYLDLPMGVSEAMPLDFHSPYGCSKGTADQYVRDYHRIYGLRSVVFRQSCIYGPRQFGVEDQGWIAWFIIAAVLGRKITIYGDGSQVRDVLYVDDLIHAYELAIEKIDIAQGKIYNIGGGMNHTLSIWSEFGPKLSQFVGHPIQVEHDNWRPGDQKLYISDISKAGNEIGWMPTTGVDEGLRRLHHWVVENQNLFHSSN